MRNPVILQLLPTYIIIFLADLGKSIGIVILAPLVGDNLLNLGPYWQENMGLLSGILMALYPTGQIIGTNLIGHLSDHYGRRPTLLVTMLIAPAAFLSIALMIEYQSLTGLMICLIVTGFCEGNITIAHSMIADLIEAKERQRYFGYIHIATSLSFIVGPLLFTPVSWLAKTTIQQYTIPFYGIALICAANFPLALIYLKESNQSKIKLANQNDFFTALKSIMADKKLKLLLYFNAAVYFTIMGFFRYYPIYAVEYFNFSIQDLSLLIAACASVILLANLGLNAALARLYSPRILANVSMFGMCLGLTCLSQTKQIELFIMELMVISLMIAICLPCCHTLLSRQAQTNQQGKVMGLNQSIVVLTTAISSVFCGILFEYHVTLPLIALCLTGSLSCLLLSKSQHRTQLQVSA
ncbi:MAG: hypothetical protein CMF46_04860 [Legionellales bacterium]|nr:hypothetical protein [Legionellales bacterium]|tara:strand:- start:3356 stop:4588 length:1233 start_codon:yes stop_codon:yes gene_type:complete